MTPTTFKKYKTLAQDLEARTPLPTKTINHGLRHLEEAYTKTIVGLISKLVKNAWNYDTKLEYIEEEISLSVDQDGNELRHTLNEGRWFVRFTRTLHARFNLCYEDGVTDDLIDSKIEQWFHFKNTEELLTRGEKLIKFLEGFTLNNNQSEPLDVRH